MRSVPVVFQRSQVQFLLGLLSKLVLLYERGSVCVLRAIESHDVSN